MSKEYADRLVSGHTESCPWRDTVCDVKLGKFPKLPPRDVYSDFEQRYANIDSLMQLPALSQEAIGELKHSHRYCMTTSLRLLPVILSCKAFFAYKWRQQGAALYMQAGRRECMSTAIAGQVLFTHGAQDFR